MWLTLYLLHRYSIASVARVGFSWPPKKYPHTSWCQQLARAGTNFVINNGAIWEPKSFVHFLYKSLKLYNHFVPYDFHEFLFRPCTKLLFCSNRDLAAKSIRTRFGSIICYFSCKFVIFYHFHIGTTNTRKPNTPLSPFTAPCHPRQPTKQRTGGKPIGTFFPN